MLLRKGGALDQPLSADAGATIKEDPTHLWPCAYSVDATRILQALKSSPSRYVPNHGRHEVRALPIDRQARTRLDHARQSVCKLGVPFGIIAPYALLCSLQNLWHVATEKLITPTTNVAPLEEGLRRRAGVLGMSVLRSTSEIVRRSCGFHSAKAPRSPEIAWARGQLHIQGHARADRLLQPRASIHRSSSQQLVLSSKVKARRALSSLLGKRSTSSIEADPEVMAHRYHEAGMVDAASTYFQRAGDRAAARSAYIEAAAHFKAANLAVESARPTRRQCGYAAVGAGHATSRLGLLTTTKTTTSPTFR